MNKKLSQLALAVSFAFTLNAAATTRYVNLDSPNPTPPYTNWAMAATQIQDAIDVAAAGDEVLVTNGVYQTGGKVLTSDYTNRIALTQPLTVRSVNGPAVTVIRGVPGIGPEAARCAYLNEGATLSGFTLADGGTRRRVWPMPITTYWGGGVFCVSGAAVVTNCVIVGNAADESAGGVYSGTLIDCEISGNYAGYHGGGAFRSSLTRCQLNSNQSWNYGGGAEACALTACVLSNNYAGLVGGGAYQSSLDRCRILNNSAWWGAGLQECTANNCIIADNSAYEGGGARGSGLINCALVQNRSSTIGGGAQGGSLVNCTVTGNTADTGGGTFESTVANCILYFNSAPVGANYSGGLLNWSCTTPLPASGSNNFAADPQLADNFHLTATSPCLGAGNSAVTAGVDIDGEGWLNPPAIGCDQFYSGGAAGELSLVLRADRTNVATGFSVNFTAQIGGHATSSRWNFSDGTIVSNQPWTTHSWSAGGEYPVVLTVYNESYPVGISEILTVHVQPALHYVSLAGTNPIAPYSTWETAATNIQDAVDASFFGSTIIVSNGNYGLGGRVVGGSSTNRLVVTEGLVVQSLNGPAVTAIAGYRETGSTNGPNAVRCVWLRPNTKLIGFTLTNGATATDFSGEGPDPDRNGGGGLRAEDSSSVASRCVLAGNASAYYGGGAYGGTLNQCLLVDNWTGGYGGGSCSSALNNVTLARNLAAEYGGGAIYSALNNCVAYFNSAPTGPDQQDCDVNFSCLSNPSGGLGNITNAPSFSDPANQNFRLQPNSPCINAGKNPNSPADLDLDGNPRVAGGTVDMGAYEFQAPTSQLSYAWLQQYGLATDGSADYIDTDADGLNNYGEWRADTNPTNAQSVLRMVGATNSPTGAVVAWQSVATRTYWLERSTNLGGAAPFQRVATNLIGTADTMTFTDTAATNGGPYFYRVGVQ